MWLYKYISDKKRKKNVGQVPRSVTFRMRFSQIKCMKSYGNDWGNLRDLRALRRGTPLMPYAFESSSYHISVGMDTTDLACAIKESCKCSSNLSR